MDPNLEVATEPTVPEAIAKELKELCNKEDLPECSQMDSTTPVNKEPENSVLKEEILAFISNYSGDLFFKNQQRGEPEITTEEKKEITTSLLESNPSNFLARFGKVLKPNHLSYFHQYKNTYEVEFYLKQLEQNLKPSNAAIKNQRYHTMNKLIKEGQYFSMSEMRKRNPVHFHHLIEKYLTQEERRELEQEQKNMCNLSTVFMAHIDGDSESSKRKSEQMADESVWEKTSEDEESDGDDESIDEDEKNFYRDEFISSMHRSFLEGRDEEYDYSRTDLPDANVDVIYERDAEERYFDSD